MVDVLITIRMEDKPAKHLQVFVDKYDFPAQTTVGGVISRATKKT